MLEIALIGAGQLGSRHLQGLALLGRRARVTVIDPGAAALATARERFAQIRQDDVEARFSQRFDDLPASLDAAVIATAADVRREAVEELFSRSRVRVALLEKVLFQRLVDYGAVGKLLDESGTRAWVNCAQRLWPFFRDLRPLTLGKSHIEIGVSGAQWGLGCNAIHNLDLLSYLTGDGRCRIESALNPGTVPSKRAGFVEFTGTLYAFGERGNRVIQSAYREGDAPFAFDVRGDEFHAVWRVGDGALHLARANQGWKWQALESRAPFQSQLTHIVLAEMLDKGSSVLPTYAESVPLHTAMLETFLGHMNRHATDLCPVT